MENNIVDILNECEEIKKERFQEADIIFGAGVVAGGMLPGILKLAGKGLASLFGKVTAKKQAKVSNQINMNETGDSVKNKLVAMNSAAQMAMQADPKSMTLQMYQNYQDRTLEAVCAVLDYVAAKENKNTMQKGMKIAAKSKKPTPGATQ